MTENTNKGIQDVLLGAATVGRSAQESVRNGFSLLVDGVKDLRNYEVVVNLGADQKNLGNTLLYVGKDGSGDIKRMDNDTLKAQQPSATSKILNPSALSVAGLKETQEAAARAGAKVVMDNFSMTSTARNGEASFPFNPEKPHTASADSMLNVKSMLISIRADLLNDSSPDFKLDEEGRVDGVDYKNVDPMDINRRVEAVGKAIEKIEAVEKQMDYAKDLRSDLKSDAALFTPDQVTSLNKVLGDSRTFEDKLTEAVKPPFTKI